MKRIIAAAFVLFLFGFDTSSLRAEGAEPKPPEREIGEVVVPYIEGTEVILDGKLDEPAWQKAGLAKDFHLTFSQKEVERAKEQTEVRIFYDMRNFYLGIKCHESRMKELNPGGPPAPSGDAQMTWMGDEVEIFLDTSSDRKRYFHLAVTPSGAHYDALGRDATWDGNWSVKPGIAGDYWILEVIIPFSSLAGEDEFAGTPPPGAIWRGNVCRVGGASEEFSSWSWQRGGFHQPERFGKLIFSGLKGEGIAVEDVNPGAMVLGDNTFKATVRNPEKSKVEYDVSVKLQEEGQKTSKELARRKVALLPGEETVIEVPYRIETGGEKELLLSAIVDGRAVYSGSVGFSVYPVFQKVEEIKDELSSLAGEIETTPGRMAKQKRKDIAVLRGELRKLKSELSEKDNWEEKEKRARSLAQEIEGLKLFVSNQLRPHAWGQGMGSPDPSFAVGTEYAGRKVFRNKPFRGKFSETVRMALARNEYESRQIVVFALKEGLDSVKVSVTDLKNSQGTVLPAGEIELHRVGYVFVQEVSPGPHGDYWPDILYPLESFDVKPGTLQPVMITVHAPGDQQEGLYRGEIVIDGDEDESIKLHLEVKVYPFNIATTGHLKRDFWYHSHQLVAFYGDASLERFTQFVELLGRYRIAPGPDFQPAKGAIKIYREDDDRLTFDFSGLDPWMEVAIQNGMNCMNINFYQSSYSVWQETFAGTLWGGTQVIDRATGKAEKLVADDPMKTYYEFIGAAWKYFQKKGWADLVYYEGVDEPFMTDRREKLREIYPVIAKVAPGLGRTSPGAMPILKLAGYVDMWCPKLENFNPKDYVDRHEEKWWYHLGYKPGYPNYSTNATGLEPRIAPWLCWKYGITGHITWGSSYWLDGAGIAEMAKTGKKPWASPQWVGCLPEYAAGEAVYIYPTPDGPIPSLRLVNIRDGFEDYEYLYVLNELFDEARSRGVMLSQELREDTQRLLAVPPEIARSTTEWTMSPEELEETRGKVAARIALLYNKLEGK